MDHQLESLKTRGRFSEDYIWTITNAVRQIKDDALWSEHALVALPKKLDSSAASDVNPFRSMILGLCSYFLLIIGLLCFGFITVWIGSRVGIWLYSVFGVQDTGLAITASYGWHGLRRLAELMGLFAGGAIAYYIFGKVGYFRLNEYRRKRAKLIRELLRIGVSEFGGSRYEKELQSAVSDFDGVRGVGVDILHSLKEELEKGYMPEQLQPRDDGNFYSKGFKERIGGFFAGSVVWFVGSALVCLSLIFTVLFLWQRFTK